ncbi:MAG: hypothetical protein KatS3mg061_2519 [Dehalococcoidia bacterium]|nr:MAG: hypothetical protein KatS3mg061_2519 [Dehalococcoidia bacterium]
MLGAVEFSISLLEDFLGTPTVVWPAGAAHREAHRKAAPSPGQLERRKGDQPFDYLPHASRVGIGQQNGELVTSDPGHQVCRAGCDDQGARHQLEGSVARCVPVAVVDRLHPIKIDHQQAVGAPQPLGTGMVAPKGIFEGTPVGQTSEGVGQRFALQPGEQFGAFEGRCELIADRLDGRDLVGREGLHRLGKRPG